MFCMNTCKAKKKFKSKFTLAESKSTSSTSSNLEFLQNDKVGNTSDAELFPLAEQANYLLTDCSSYCQHSAASPSSA